MKGRCMTPRRHVACSTRTLVRAIALVWLGVVASWNGAAAQVGYEPGHSPYHDIPRRAVWALGFGHTGLRLVLWKLHYPLSYEVPNNIDHSSVLPAGAPLDQWTAHPWATIGVGWIL